MVTATRQRRTPAKGLKFTPGNHRYSLDGKPVPGVTTILGVVNKPALPKWAAKSVAEHVADNPDAVDALRPLGRDAVVNALKEVPWKRRDDAAHRGIALHDIAERLVLGEDVDVPDDLVPVVESTLDFLDAWDVRPVLTEARVGSREHWFAGTLDLVADTKHGRAILDYKSGKAIYASAAFQLNAYAFAEFHGEAGDEAPMADLGVERAFGVHIRADGFDVHELAFGPSVFDEFLVIRRMFDINKRAEGDWRTPGTGYVGAAMQDEGVLL